MLRKKWNGKLLQDLKIKAKQKYFLDRWFCYRKSRLVRHYCLTIVVFIKISRFVWHYWLVVVVVIKKVMFWLTFFLASGCYEKIKFVWHYCLRMKFLRKWPSTLWYLYYVQYLIVDLFLHCFQASFTLRNICVDAKLGSFSNELEPSL